MKTKGWKKKTLLSDKTSSDCFPTNKRFGGCFFFLRIAFKSLCQTLIIYCTLNQLWFSLRIEKLKLIIDNAMEKPRYRLFLNLKRLWAKKKGSCLIRKFCYQIIISELKGNNQILFLKKLVIFYAGHWAGNKDLSCVTCAGVCAQKFMHGLFLKSASANWLRFPSKLAPVFLIRLSLKLITRRFGVKENKLLGSVVRSFSNKSIPQRLGNMRASELTDVNPPDIHKKIPRLGKNRSIPRGIWEKSRNSVRENFLKNYFLFSKLHSPGKYDLIA